MPASMAVSPSCASSLAPHLCPSTRLSPSSKKPTSSSAFSFRVPKYPTRFQAFSMRQQLKEVTGQSWTTSILKSGTPVLVEFHTSWCGPCQMVHRVIGEIAAEYAGKLECFVVHADQEPRLAEEYDIKAVPIVLLFKNGEKCESVVGTMPKEFYVTAIERVLAS